MEPLRELFEDSWDIVFCHDLEGRITRVNRTGAALHGYDMARALDSKLQDLHSRSAPGEFELYITTLRRDRKATGRVYVTSNGQERLLEFRSLLAPDNTGRPIVWSVARDITERIRAERALKTQAAQQAAVAALGQLAIKGALQDIIEAAMVAVRTTLDLELASLAELVDDDRSLLVRGSSGWAGSNAPIPLESDSAIVVQDYDHSDLLRPTADRHPGIRSGIAAPIRCEAGHFGVFACFAVKPRAFSLDDVHFVESVANVIGTAVDRERSREALVQREEALKHQALHDTLTGLPNRTLLFDRLQQAIASATRQQVGGSLLMIDLDRFKDVNDTFGHGYGDDLLREIALRLQHTLRASDTVARLGGDEFAVVLSSCSDPEAARSAARKIITAISQPAVIHDQALNVGASIGVALFPDHGQDAATLMRYADVAMYEAKRSQAGVVVFTVEQQDEISARVSLARDLRQALQTRSVELLYQPKIDLKTGAIVGAEALARWLHPEMGPIPPQRFVALAEQYGLAQMLTRQVFGMACQQLADWREQGLNLTLAVNISVRNLGEPNFTDAIATIMAEAGVPASSIILELTESSLLSDRRHQKDLNALCGLGLRLSVDDYGTGYSSLTYLRRLPLNELKIDRSFIRRLNAEAGDLAVVESTVRLGHTLSLEVVAEGVEDKQTLQRLTLLGCDLAQGFYIGSPMAPAELEQLVKAGRSGRSRPKARWPKSAA